jgi:low molecular weight protein-tyrosine phosphatase
LAISEDARILIVCTGNICRSPFIARLLQRRLDEHRPGSDHGIQVQSAGTSAMTGWSMDERAAAQLVAYGGNPAGFTARDLTPELIAESDLILTATRAHRGKVATMHPKALRQVFTLCDFADLVAGIDGLTARVTNVDPRVWVRQVTEKAAASRGLKPPLEPAQADIVDPFGRDDEVFATMAEQVVASMTAVVRALAG